ncbi:D-alanyl-D-alanine carboxypeptidase family protein [Brevibacillus sp. GCM10020057]|uniref:M15 family metallopeptidase n=1 Tax=Brevibacillus sp. GCM10020057 TaxID=3317327 RepID=UPI00364278FC
MRRVHKTCAKQNFLLASAVVLLLAGCSSTTAPGQPDAATPTTPAEQTQPAPANAVPNQPAKNAPQPSADQKPDEAPKPSTEPAKGPATKPAQKPAKAPSSYADLPDLEVVAEPESITVLVNKQRQLPDDYEPTDLEFPNVPYLLPEKSVKRQMRKEAAAALEQLFAAAKKDGIALAGVSAYRPHSYQKALFERYVKQDGLEKARTYSAVPGTSEHETGLAIDVSGIDGKCAATSCFAGTKEAKWLAEHAQEYGFIIRYPEGKDAITGYIYEPWHLRYVGNEVAQAISEKHITLEEYFGVVPVSSEK